MIGFFRLGPGGALDWHRNGRPLILGPRRGDDSRFPACGLARGFAALVARQRTNHHVDSAPDQLRLKVRVPIGGNVTEKLLHHLEAIFRVRQFPAPEL